MHDLIFHWEKIKAISFLHQIVPYSLRQILNFYELRQIISWRDKIKDFKMVTESFLRTFFWQCAYLKPSSQSWLFIKIEIWYPKTFLRNEIARKLTYMSEGDINNVTSKKWPKICYFGGKFDFPYAFWSEEVLVSTPNCLYLIRINQENIFHT